MAVRFSVYRTSDRDFVRSHPDLADPEALAQWERDCDARLLLDGSLGSGGAWHRFWSIPAGRMGLAMASRFQLVHTKGLEIQSRGELDQLRGDVVALQRFWADEIDSSDVIVHRISGHDFAVPVVADLYHRAEQLLGGVRVAERCSAFISIS